MRVAVLFNRGAGAATTPAADRERTEKVRAAFEAAGVTAEIRLVPGERLGIEAERAARSGVDALVGAGGDGTINAVAAAAVESDLPLGIIPLGTLNHFAKDLGLPFVLEEVVGVVAAGRTRTVDVGEVNGRIFLNNASLGAYAIAVRRRDRFRFVLGRGKWSAMARAMFTVFRRVPVVTVRIESPDETIYRQTPFVFVGNNRYAMHLLSLGSRECLDKGELSLYLTSRTGRMALVRLTFRALFNRLDQAKDFDSLCLKEFWVDVPRPTLHVAIDGEVERFTAPLRFRVLPQRLKVFAPAAPTTA